MALLEDRTAVFIVRVWCERGDGVCSGTASPEWRGSVEHVQSKHRIFFRHLEAVSTFMKPHLESLGIDPQQRFWECISSDIEGEPEPQREPAAPSSRASRPAQFPSSNTARKRR